MTAMNRMPSGYKQTEVGVIPEDWEVKLIGQCLQIRHGKNQADVVCTNGEYPILGTGGEMGRASRPLYSKPSVLIGRKGTIDVPRYLETPFWTVDTLFYSEIAEGVSPKFMFYQFCLIDWYSYNEASGVPSLNAKTIENIQLSVPPLPEQRAIATALSDVDALLAAQDKLIAKKRDIKQATMQQLLTGKQRLPGFSGEWEVKRLGDLLAYEQPTKYLVADSEYSDDNDVPVLTAGKTFILGYTDEEHGIFNNLPAIIFDDFTTANKYVTFPFKAKSSAMKILKPRDTTVNLRLVFEMMQLIKFQLGDHKRYWISEFQNLELKIPDAEEQTAIAAVLSDMDADLAALEQQRDKTRALKQGMMQALLTGRIRLV